jgi:hypothetical protein
MGRFIDLPNGQSLAALLTVSSYQLYSEVRDVSEHDTMQVLANNVIPFRFEVFPAVTMKNNVFWDVTPCGSCKNRCFVGTWYFFAASVYY